MSIILWIEMLPTIILLFLLLLISLLTLQIISSSTFMSQCLSPVALLVIFTYHESLNCYCCLVRTLNMTRMMLWWNVHVHGVSCWLHFQLSRCSNDGISHYCFQRSSTLRKVQLAEFWFNLLETPILLAGSLITVKPTVFEKVTCQR